MVSSYKSVKRPECSNIFLFQDAAVRLRAIAAQREPTINGNRLAGDVIVRLKKKAHGAGDIFRPPEARHSATGDVPIVFSGLHAGGGHADGSGSGSDYVHAHTIPFLGQNARGVHQRRLRRGVIQAGWKDRKCLHGGEQHHAATLRAAFHCRTELFCQENGPHVVGFQRGEQSFMIQVFEGYARRVTWKDGEARERRANLLRGGEIGLADCSGTDVSCDERKGATEARLHRVAQSFGALAIGAIAHDELSTFSREERDGGGAQAARAAGDDDGLTGESLFGKVVLKLVVRVRLTRVPILRGHVLLEWCRDLPHV